jgi:[ribosomal protein S5]-alanine N-acetyltransferase
VIGTLQTTALLTTALQQDVAMTLTLLPIGLDGTPATKIEALPEPAQQVCKSTARLYQRAGFAPPWIGYLAVQNRNVVGACAFKSPAINNLVEIAYYTFADYEGCGVATAMANALVKIAQDAAPAVAVVAQTEPHANASNSILQNLGFRFAGTVHHPEDGAVWEWRLAKP